MSPARRRTQSRFAPQTPCKVLRHLPAEDRVACNLLTAPRGNDPDSGKARRACHLERDPLRSGLIGREGSLTLA